MQNRKYNLNYEINLTIKKLKFITISFFTSYNKPCNGLPKLPNINKKL